MKAIKIILAVVVVAILGFFVWNWLIKPITPPEPPTPPRNQFIERIEMEIDSVGKMPTNSFCSEFYQKIQFDISEFHSKGYLGDTTTSDNDQWKEILSKNLYSAYAPKFVEQAMNVFNGHEWKTDDLKFIRSEARELQKSDYLKSDSPVKASFVEIDTILAKYDKIVGFIYKCDKFGAPNNDLLSEFPDASNNIKIASNYLKNNLGNRYVNNCTRLRDSLGKVPQLLLNKHKTFLENKIGSYADPSKFNNYGNHKEWNDSVYQPISNQIARISNVSYKLSDVESIKTSLYELLDEFSDDAYDYYKVPNQPLILE